MITGSTGKEERTWAMLCHLTSFVGFVIPFGSVLGPLVVWFLKKDQFPLVNDQGKEAMNFQITMTIFEAIATLLAFLLIGFFLLVPLVLIDVIFTVIASVKANEGVAYRYPFKFTFFR